MQRLIGNSNFVVFFFDDYDTKIFSLMKELKKKGCKVCHVLLRVPYDYFISDLKEENALSNNFYFIDVLSSHYKTPQTQQNCIYLDYPDPGSLLDAVKSLLEENRCQLFIFDSITSLLKYHPRIEIQKLTNNLKSELNNKAKLVFLMPKKEELELEESKYLLNDLELFADSIKELF